MSRGEELDYPEEKRAVYSSYLDYMVVPYSSVSQFLTKSEPLEEPTKKKKEKRREEPLE